VPEIEGLLVQVGSACTGLLSESGLQWIPGGLAFRCLGDIIGSLKSNHPYRIDALSNLVECFARNGEQINISDHCPWFQDILAGTCSAMKRLGTDESHFGEWIVAILLRVSWQMPSESPSEALFANMVLVTDTFADLTFSICTKTLPMHMTDSSIARYYALVRSTLRFKNLRESKCNFAMTLGVLAGMFVGSGSIQRNDALDFRKSILSDVFLACRISCETGSESMKSSCAVALGILWKHCRVTWPRESLDCLLSSSLQLFFLGVERSSDLKSCSLPPRLESGFQDIAQSIKSCCLESFSVTPLRFDAVYQNHTLAYLASWAEGFYHRLERNHTDLRIQHELASIMFEFIIQIVSLVTLSGSRMPPLSPFHVLHIFGFLQVWRPVQNPFYGQMILDAMQYTSQSPLDAIRLARSLPSPVEIKPKIVMNGLSQFDRLVGSRIQFLLNALIPACPVLPQENLLNNVAPLAFLCLGDNHPPIADAGNDALCGSFAVLKTNMELLSSLRNDYLKESLAIAINWESNERALHTWQSRFDIGLTALMSAAEHNSEFQLDTTQLVFTYCEEAMNKNLHRVVISAIEAVLCLLQSMPIQIIPTFCLQIQLFLEAIYGTSCYDQVCTILFQVVQSVQDSIRKLYLVEQYPNILASSQPKSADA
jgi:hypothetical protein